MIPEAAVGAARTAIHRVSLDAFTHEEADVLARHALEAAAPHMRQAFYLDMNLRAVQDELRATPIYPLGNIEDKRT